MQCNTNHRSILASYSMAEDTCIPPGQKHTRRRLERREKNGRERCESPQIPRLHSMINCRNWMWKCIHGAALTMAGRITKLQAVINFLGQLHFNGITFVVLLRVCGSSQGWYYKSIDPGRQHCQQQCPAKCGARQKHGRARRVACFATHLRCHNFKWAQNDSIWLLLYMFYAI